MNKYQLLAITDVLEVILILGIIVIAGIFSNWWLLLLLLLLSKSEYEKRILNSTSDKRGNKTGLPLIPFSEEIKEDFKRVEKQGKRIREKRRDKK